MEEDREKLKDLNPIVEICNAVVGAHAALHSVSMDGSHIRNAKDVLAKARKLIPQVTRQSTGTPQVSEGLRDEAQRFCDFAREDLPEEITYGCEWMHRLRDCAGRLRAALNVTPTPDVGLREVIQEIGVVCSDDYSDHHARAKISEMVTAALNATHTEVTPKDMEWLQSEVNRLNVQCCKYWDELEQLRDKVSEVTPGVVVSTLQMMREHGDCEASFILAMLLLDTLESQAAPAGDQYERDTEIINGLIDNKEGAE